MAKQKKQVINTGNGDGKAILAENQPTEASSKPSQPLTSIADGSTKPLTVAEGLSLLQTNCLDLQAQGCKVVILAQGDRFAFFGRIPASIGELTFDGGHLRINGKPVSDGMK